MDSSQSDGTLDELRLAEKNMRLHLSSEAHRRHHGRQPDLINCVECERTIRRLLAALDASRSYESVFVEAVEEHERPVREQADRLAAEYGAAWEDVGRLIAVTWGDPAPRGAQGEETP